MKYAALIIAAVTLAGCQTSPEMQRLGYALQQEGQRQQAWHEAQRAAFIQQQQRCYYRQWGNQIIQQCW
jgi:flagellar basal body L-ring protein FlgH